MSLARREGSKDEGGFDALQARNRSRDSPSQPPGLDRNRLEFVKEGTSGIGAVAHLPADRLRGDDADRFEHAKLPRHGWRGKTGSTGDFAHMQFHGGIREEQSNHGFAGAPEER